MAKKTHLVRRKNISFFKKAVFVFFFALSAGVMALTFLFLYYVKDFPRPEIFSERQLSESSKIYDRTGEILLYEIYGEEKRTWIPLTQISPDLKNLVILTEDANFYTHFGIDVKGVIRAVLADLKIGQPVYGGSTIPQQLIRSTFLSMDKTAERKIREIILAIELDRRYSKDQILEWYLNQIPFGQNAYGVEAASRTYFNKSASSLSVAEAATLSALIQSPYRLSPYSEEGKKKLLARKDYILERALAKNIFPDEIIEKARSEEIKFAENKTEIKAPYFTLWVKQQLEEKYGEDFLMQEGLKIYTTLDWKTQQQAEEAVRLGIEKNKIFNAHNAALLSVDPKSGQILAMTVGSGDYYSEPYPAGCTPGVDCLFDPKFNVVVGTKKSVGRQPGSAFKPFVYVTAFEKGFDDKYVIVDEPTNFGFWGGKEYVPQNFDGLFRGQVTLRQALAQSLNIPAVKTLLNLAGLADSIKTAQNLGISTLNPPFGPAIVLGGWEVKLLDMTSAYSAFANDGMLFPPSSILKIIDKKGDIIEQSQKTPKRVLDSQAVRLLNDILSDNAARAPIFGARSNLYFENYQVAVKTGTTDDFKDGWALGYTPSLTVGVWVGNNNNEPMAKKPAIDSAGAIFHSFMDKMLPEMPKENFLKPGQN